MADTEADGCGALGARIYLWSVANGQQLYTLDPISWPRHGRSVTVVARLSTDEPAGGAPPTVIVFGEVIGGDQYAPPGTSVVARIGDTTCGVGSTRRTGSFSGYIVSIAGPGAIPGCTRGGQVTFHVDGRQVSETTVNEPGREDQLDLVVP
jgi:hypothetical protein